MPRFMSDGPRPCKIVFVLRSYTLHELCDQTFRLVSSSVSSKQLLCFVQSRPKKRTFSSTSGKLIIIFEIYFSRRRQIRWSHEFLFLFVF